MWRRFLQWVMDRRPTKRFDVDGEPLFYRSFLFRTGPWVWYLHHYLRGDPDVRGHHDHPMRAWIVVLAGGYDEEVVSGLSLQGGVVHKQYHRRPGSIRHLRPYALHKLVIDKVHVPVESWMDYQWVQPTSWSLFISRYVEKPWGFFRAEPKSPPDPMLPRLVDRVRYFTYTEAGGGIDENEPWWLTAPNGRELRLAPNRGADRRTERQPVVVDAEHVGGPIAGG